MDDGIFRGDVSDFVGKGSLGGWVPVSDGGEFGGGVAVLEKVMEVGEKEGGSIEIAVEGGKKVGEAVKVVGAKAEEASPKVGDVVESVGEKAVEAT